MPQNETIQDLGLDEYKYNFVTEGKPVFQAEKGLSEDIPCRKMMRFKI